LESEAKLFIQHKIIEHAYDLVWSYMLDYENSVNPYEERKNAIADWCTVAAIRVRPSSEICEMAKILLPKGIKTKDALHVACAIQAQCDYFLTTDKRLINKTVAQIELINPLDFIRKAGEDT
jgi:predicted nucleic acid-binding protein